VVDGPLRPGNTRRANGPHAVERMTTAADMSVAEPKKTPETLPAVSKLAKRLLADRQRRRLRRRRSLANPYRLVDRLQRTGTKPWSAICPLETDTQRRQRSFQHRRRCGCGEFPGSVRADVARTTEPHVEVRVAPPIARHLAQSDRGRAP
jgi:hypothetical protein